MLRIWGRRTSSNVQAVMWCVAELGIEHERYDVGHRHGGNDTPEFLAMNPNGRVPVVSDDDGPPIWESSAILRYLASRHGEAPFWPADLAERVQVDKWAEWAKVNVTGAFTVPIFWRLVRTPEAERDTRAIAAAVAALDRSLSIAEARLGEAAWLAGESFTLADIVFGHLLYRYYAVDIPRPASPALQRYYDRLTERPAYREHVMVPFDELRVA